MCRAGCWKGLLSDVGSKPLVWWPPSLSKAENQRGSHVGVWSAVTIWTVRPCFRPVTSPDRDEWGSFFRPEAEHWAMQDNVDNEYLLNYCKIYLFTLLLLLSSFRSLPTPLCQLQDGLLAPWTCLYHHTSRLVCQLSVGVSVSYMGLSPTTIEKHRGPVCSVGTAGRTA